MAEQERKATKRASSKKSAAKKPGGSGNVLPDHAHDGPIGGKTSDIPVSRSGKATKKPKPSKTAAAKKRGSTKAKKPTRGRGRPSKISLGWNSDTLDWTAASPAQRVLGALRAGNHVGISCKYGGINPATHNSWLRRGEEAMAHVPDDQEFDLMELKKADLPYAVYSIEFERALAGAEVDLVTFMRTAAREDWRAAAHLLARRHPERWADRSRIELTGPGDEPVHVDVTGGVNVSGLLAEAVAKREKQRAASEQGDGS